MSKANYPAQNAGHPKRDKTSDHWRNSILVGPQTAGIPTVHNEDEWHGDADTLGSDDAMQPNTPVDRSGDVLTYHRSQRGR